MTQSNPQFVPDPVPSSVATILATVSWVLGLIVTIATPILDGLKALPTNQTTTALLTYGGIALTIVGGVISAIQHYTATDAQTKLKMARIAKGTITVLAIGTLLVGLTGCPSVPVSPSTQPVTPAQALQQQITDEQFALSMAELVWASYTLANPVTAQQAIAFSRLDKAANDAIAQAQLDLASGKTDVAQVALDQARAAVRSLSMVTQPAVQWHKARLQKVIK